jgi:limonene-1,2-epoxide hydrolase
MTSDSSADLVTSFISAIEARDLERALGFLTEDVEYDNVPMAKLHGVGAVREMLAPFIERFEEVAWPVSHLVSSGTADDGVVFTERVDRFRAGEQWVEVPVAGMFLLSGGKISLWRDYFDLGGFTSQVASLS